MVAMSPYSDAGEPEGFLAHQEALRRLARSLLADPLRAEDLVQETWLAARGRSPRRPEAHRAWLAGILRHLAWKAERGEQRRRKREQSSARPEASQETDDVETALATQRRILQAVQELDEPYRTAIVLRYYRDLTPAEIAERLGAPVGTVKTRLRRGLGILRARLQREHGGEDAFATALLLLAGRRWAPDPSSVAAGLAAGVGGIVGTKLWIGVGAAVLVGLGVTYVLREDEARPEPTRVANEAESAFAVAPASGKQPLAAPAPQPRQGIDSPAPWRWEDGDAGSPAWRLLLRIGGLREQESGTIAIGVRTSILEPALASFERPVANQIALEFPAPPSDEGKAPGPLLVELDHPSYMPARAWLVVSEGFDPEAPRALELEVHLMPALGIVTGKLEAEGEVIPEEAVVALFGMEPSGKPKMEPTEVGRCSPDGSFRLRSPSRGPHVVVAVAPSSLGGIARPANARVQLERDSPFDARVLHLGSRAVISGEAFLPDGRPPRVGQIRASMVSESGPMVGTWYIERYYLMWTGETFENQGVHVSWDESGHFRLAGLAPGEYRLSADAHSPDYDSRIPSNYSSVPADDPIVAAPAEGVRFELAVCSQLFVVRGLGAPQSKAVVRRPMEGGSSGSSTDEHGRVIVGWSAHERQRLTFERAGFVSKEIELDPADVTPGQAMYVDLEPGPPPGRLMIRPRGLSREILATDFLLISLYDPGAPERPFNSWSKPQADLVTCVGGAFLPPPARLENGEIVISDVKPRRYRLLIQVMSLARSASFAVPVQADVEIEPGETELFDWEPQHGGLVRLNYKDASGSRSVSLELRDGAGNKLDARFQNTTPPKRSGPSLHGPDLYEFDPLPPGNYVLTLRLRGLPARILEFEVRAGETTDIDFDADAP
jgi:RNA polymerase sigma factor (sigma-70 family)